MRCHQNPDGSGICKDSTRTSALGRGYFVVKSDKTTCGGKIIGGADDHTNGETAGAGLDKVTCGKHSGICQIVSGVAQTDIHGRLVTGLLDSKSSFPCKARFIASMMNDAYETRGNNSETE